MIADSDEVRLEVGLTRRARKYKRFYGVVLNRENAMRLATTLLNWVEFNRLKIEISQPDVIRVEELEDADYQI